MKYTIRGWIYELSAQPLISLKNRIGYWMSGPAITVGTIVNPSNSIQYRITLLLSSLIHHGKYSGSRSRAAHSNYQISKWQGRWTRRIYAGVLGFRSNLCRCTGVPVATGQKKPRPMPYSMIETFFYGWCLFFLIPLAAAATILLSSSVEELVSPLTTPLSLLRLGIVAMDCKSLWSQTTDPSLLKRHYSGRSVATGVLTSFVRRYLSSQ
jgi:hypothetical protein